MNTTQNTAPAPTTAAPAGWPLRFRWVTNPAPGVNYGGMTGTQYGYWLRDKISGAVTMAHDDAAWTRPAEVEFTHLLPRLPGPPRTRPIRHRPGGGMPGVGRTVRVDRGPHHHRGRVSLREQIILGDDTPGETDTRHLRLDMVMVRAYTPHHTNSQEGEMDRPQVRNRHSHPVGVSDTATATVTTLVNTAGPLPAHSLDMVRSAVQGWVSPGGAGTTPHHGLAAPTGA